MIYVLLDVLDIDMMGGLGFILFQPILAFIITSLTILACLVIGLPIRLIKKFKAFWLSWPLIPVIGAVLGILLLLIAYNGNFTQIKEITLVLEKVQKEVPNTTMSITGWFLTAFSLLHFYPQALIGLLRRRKR